MLLASLKATSQTIDTTVKNCTAAKINLVIYKHDIPSVSDTLTYLGVFNYTDDLKGNCVANWVLIAKDKNILFDSYKLNESEYSAWDGSAIGLLRVIGNYLQVTFK